MSILDSVIRELSPSRYEQRLKAKASAFMIERDLHKMKAKDEVSRMYEGASNTRRGASFRGANSNSANTDAGRYAKTLRERSRYNFKNTATTKRAVRSIANNVVGLGIIPTPVCANDKVLAKVKEYWKYWGDKKTCDWNGKCNFYGLQKLVIKTSVLSGECYAIRKRVKSSINKLGLEIMLLEPEFLDNDKNTTQTESGGYIQNGIEYNKDGKIIKYWFFPIHPDIRYEPSIAIDAKDVAHAYTIDRPGQDRGIPEGASIILTEKDLDDYKDSELMGKKIGAAFAGYIRTTDPDADEDDADDLGNTMVEPGTIRRLKPGEEITFSTPPSSAAFDPFVSVYKREIASGWGISYEMLTGDYSRVNFSSGRMGWIETQRNFDDWQWFQVIPDFCDIVYQWFLEAVSIVIGQDITTIVTVNWTTPRREMIDPVKEVTAIKEQLKSGILSYQEVLRMQSYLPEDVFSELQQDAKKFGVDKFTPDWLIPNVPKNETPPPGK